MNYAYDFHIHTGASPCANKDMTPNNIVNMAILKELDAIAITDHNTCANVEAVMKVAQGTSLVVIPGMELETSEEIHMIVLLPNMQEAIELQNIVYSHLPSIDNRKDIFGEQWIYDTEDEKIGEIDRLLLTATSLSVYDVVQIAKRMGGVCYPAHIDRMTYSIISNLGWIPSDLQIKNIEISRKGEDDYFQTKYQELQIIRSSDAHYLQDISERQNYMEISNNTLECWIKLLKNV